jgi:hypothetical protein
LEGFPIFHELLSIVDDEEVESYCNDRKVRSVLAPFVVNLEVVGTFKIEVTITGIRNRFRKRREMKCSFRRDIHCILMFLKPFVNKVFKEVVS